MVKDWKKKAVEDLASDIAKYKFAMITDMTGLPARELQHLRFNLEKDLKVVISKKTIIKRALEKAKMKALATITKGIPALLLSNTDPFELSIKLDKEKVPSYIKPRQKAEIDISIPAGPTDFPPGPILTELADVGLKTKIEGGKIKIIRTKIVAKEGDVVDDNRLAAKLDC